MLQWRAIHLHLIKHARTGAAGSTLATHTVHGSRAADPWTTASLEHLLGMLAHPLSRHTAATSPADTAKLAHALHLLAM